MINTLEAGLLLVGGGVILNAIVGYSHSRKIQYLEKKMNEQEQQLQQAIGEVKTAFEGFKTRRRRSAWRKRFRPDW
jgi:cell division protein FtsL